MTGHRTEKKAVIKGTYERKKVKLYTPKQDK